MIGVFVKLDWWYGYSLTYYQQKIGKPCTGFPRVERAVTRRYI